MWQIKLVHSREGHSTWNSGWIHYMQNRVHHIVLERPAVRTWDENIRRRRRRSRRRKKRRHKDGKKETGEIERVRLGKNTEARRRRVKEKRNEEEDVATGQSPRPRIYHNACTHTRPHLTYAKRGPRCPPAPK